MASVSFSLITVQDAFQVADPAPPQAANNVTPVNANQAQGAPAPVDTVTLTNQTAEGQQTGADPSRSHFERAVFLGAAAAYIGTNAARPNRRPPEPPLPLLPPLRQIETAPAAPATTASSTAGNPAANAAANAANTANVAGNAANAAAAGNPASGSSANSNAPQQELQTLDQTLQQLGINPQSIPLFNRMAMLLYANDPAALRLLVQTLQGAATQQSSAQTTNPAGSADQAAVQALLPPATPASQSQGTAQPPATAPAAAQAQTQQTSLPLRQTGQAAGQVDVIATQINFTEVQATFDPAPASVAQPTSGAPAEVAASTQSAQPGAPTVQIEERQVAFQAVEFQQGPQQLNASSAQTSSGTSLNVTA